jgi:long-subunit fatty acid transport protein
MRRLITAIFWILPVSGLTQYSALGSWNILNLKYSYNEKTSIFGEAQLRSLAFYNQFHYYEYKGGVSYKANKNLSLTLGLGSYQTYKEGGNFLLPKNNNEFRIWPQVSLNQSIGSLKIEQRYRAELRFTSNGYRNRFRYRLGLAHPIDKNRGANSRFQVSASNELFFTDKEPYFERNRLAFGLHYRPSRNTVLQIGYLHQFDYRINDETGRDFLQVGYFIELFRKKTASVGTEVLKEN